MRYQSSLNIKITVEVYREEEIVNNRSAIAEEDYFLSTAFRSR